MLLLFISLSKNRELKKNINLFQNKKNVNFIKKGKSLKSQTFSLKLQSDSIKFKYAIGTKRAPNFNSKTCQNIFSRTFYGHVEYHEKTLAESLKQTSQPQINKFSMKMKNIEREKNEFEITKFIDGTIYHFLS